MRYLQDFVFDSVYGQTAEVHAALRAELCQETERSDAFAVEGNLHVFNNGARLLLNARGHRLHLQQRHPGSERGNAFVVR